MWFAGLVGGLLLGWVIEEYTHIRFIVPLCALVGLVWGIAQKKPRPQQAHDSALADQLQSLRTRVVQLEMDVARLKTQGNQSADMQAESAPSTPILPPTVSDLKTDIYENIPSDGRQIEPQLREPAMDTGSWFSRGNMLAKFGALLLFFGVASALKLAIDYGLISPIMRVAGAALLGVVMIAFGMRKVAERDGRHVNFGLALQGGGYATLYLATYFALAWFHLITTSAALVSFLLISGACAAAAVHQRAEPLAVMGLGGGFVAPLLASTGAGSHIVLFTLYSGIDIAVLALCVGTGWRRLPIAALAFTLGIGILWAERFFTPELYVSTQAFLAIFFVMFSLIPVVMKSGDRDERDTPEIERWALVFAVPVAAWFAQWSLLHRVHAPDMSYVVSALALAACYLGLACAPGNASKRLKQCHLGLALVWFTAAIPYAFAATTTTALWVVEGTLLAWFGSRQTNRLMFRAGLILQLAGAAQFVMHAFSRTHGIDITGIYAIVVLLFVAAIVTVHVIHQAEEAWLPGENRVMVACIEYAAAVVMTWLSLVAAYRLEMRPESATPLVEAHVAQGILTIAWAVAALATMIMATRGGQRHRWITGMTLLGMTGVKLVLFDVADKGTLAWTVSIIGVGLLILAASYFSPAPPKAEASRP
jgi:uncharacterized membrane protein